MSTTTPTAEQSTLLLPEFIQQAQSLIQGGELLPSGANHLARRLQTAVETNTPLRIKLGLDPTRPDLHLGHAVVLKKLRAFQDLGHQAVLIIGDATALIGDPSGRNNTRPPLTEAEVLVNAQTYLDQASKIINLEKAEIVRNSVFFNEMGLQGLLQLTAQVTVAQILARDDFSKRYAQNTPIALHEFLYPLMQAYDSVMVRADLELGGSDQRFNNLLGREMQLAYAKLRGEDPAGINPQLVLLLPLLEGTDGKVKMSKSYPENCINLTDSPSEMFGKLMSIPDAMILRYETLLAQLPEQQLKQHADMLADPEGYGINPREMKVGLAKFIVASFHSGEAAELAEQGFNAQFRDKALPTDIPEYSLAADAQHPLVELLVETGLAPSKSEARRLIQGGAVKLNGETKMADLLATLSGKRAESLVLQAGKRKFIRLVFS
jgi:tyrosyl-tRNA synthetase